MDLHISLTRPGQYAAEIHRQLRSRILDGELRAGDRLPPTRELAHRLDVSRTTVVTAYDRLISEGYLESRVGSGTFVGGPFGSRESSHQTARYDTVLRPRRVWADVSVPPAPERPPAFDFRPGLPDAGQFPLATWRRLITHELRQPQVGLGSYAPPAGDEGLRQAITRHLAVARGVDAATEDVVITNGTQQAIDVIARALLEPGDLVAVEDPGYAPPARLLTTLGARVQGIPVDEDGLVVDALPPRTRLVIVSPSHQYPLGATMSTTRRLALLDWARTHDAAVVEDDYDSEFRFDGRPVEPLRSLDDHGRVIYVGTFSKTMLPMLRLGFIVAPSSLTEAITAAKFVSDWHAPVPNQAALAQFLDEGRFTRHVRRMRRIYRTRYELIMHVLERDFSDLLAPLPTSAGLHTTALAVDHDSDSLSEAAGAAREHGVLLHLLDSCTIDAVPPPGVILGYGSIDTDRIKTGLTLLRDALTGPTSGRSSRRSG